MMILKKTYPYYKGMHIIIEDIFIDDVVDASSVKTNAEMDSFTKSDLPYEYEFISNDNSLFEKEGECVIDQISKIVGEVIKGFRREN